LDPDHLGEALMALREARGTTDPNKAGKLIDEISACLNSVVGASKILHFVNPQLFPIWDSNVERFRLGRKPYHPHMRQVRNYTIYCSQVYEVLQAAGFPEFYSAFNEAFRDRLSRLGIPLYSLTEVRTVESAAFELAGNSEADDET
jgi:hypothetical protein